MHKQLYLKVLVAIKRTELYEHYLNARPHAVFRFLIAFYSALLTEPSKTENKKQQQQQKFGFKASGITQTMLDIQWMGKDLRTIRRETASLIAITHAC